MKTLIGITGKAGSGKDTVAGYLCTVYGFTRYGFADPIKQMLGKIGVDCWSPHLKEVPVPWCGVSPRRMAQTLGTDWGRQLIHPDLWLLIAGQYIDHHQEHSVVIPDVRFENEVAWIRAQGGQVWHLHRPTAIPVESHVSEMGVVFRQGDGVLVNDGTMSLLYQRIDIRMRMIRIEKHVHGA